MDQKPFIDLLPSEQLKTCIAVQGHRFRDRELIVITERYAKTFAQRQSLLRQLAEHCREENDRSFAAELYRQHERAMDSVKRSDPGTVYYVEIITDEDSPAEHAVCASFEAALRTVQAFGQEFACPFTDDSEIRIVKETLFGQTIDFDRQLLGEVNLTKELQPGGYVEAWDDDEEQITVWDLYDAESENNVLYPKILKQPCSPVRFPARFGAEYGMQISRFRCNEYDDAYVIRLDSPSVSAEDLTNFHNAHRHIPIPTLEQVDLNELPELERKNYLRLEKYLKNNGMI